MKQIVITGATSFIGNNLIKKFLESDYYIYAVVRPNTKNINSIIKHKNVEIIELSIEDMCELSKFISGEIEFLFHLAWEGTRNPYRDNSIIQEKNYKASIQVIEEANKLGCKKFIGIGSQAEYGIGNEKVDELSVTNPLTEYGKYKLNTKESCEQIALKVNMKFIWARIFSVYGIHDNNKTLIMYCLRQMLKNEEVLLTKCTQKWDFTYVDDVVNALFELAIQDCENGVYNISSGNTKILSEFILEMKEITNSKSKLSFGIVPCDVSNSVGFEAIVNKLKKETGWEAKISFKKGVQELVKYMKNKEAEL